MINIIEVGNSKSLTIPKGVRADKWERQGNEWEPQLHFTGIGYDLPEVQDLMDRYGEHVVAWFYTPMFGGLELQFGSGEASREAMFACLQGYERLPMPTENRTGRKEKLVSAAEKAHRREKKRASKKAKSRNR